MPAANSTACTLSVATTAANPPLTVYSAVSAAIIAMVCQSSNCGATRRISSAPAYSAPAMSMRTPPISETTEW